MTSIESSGRSFARALLYRLRRATLRAKMRALVILLSLVYAAVAFTCLESTVRPVIDKMLEQQAQSVAHEIAESVGPAVESGDDRCVEALLEVTRTATRDVQYIALYDARGTEVARTARGELPPPAGSREFDGVRRIVAAHGPLFDVWMAPGHLCPLALRVGMTDRSAGELGARRYALGLSLAALMLVGFLLALTAIRVMTRPIRRLASVADRFGHGDFEARAEIEQDGAIGVLADAFNRMAERLEKNRDQLLERERERTRLVDRIIEAQEAERKTIALELHDHVGQSLLAFLLSVEAGAPLQPESDAEGPACPGWEAPASPASGASSCEACTSIDITGGASGPCPIRPQLAVRIRALVEDVRQLARGMRPSVLDDYGLHVALKRHVEQMAARSRIAIDYEAAVPPGASRLPPQMAVTLFRVAQEAISNVIRHSGATQASVILLRTEDDVMLIIEDEGRGFDAPAARARGATLGLVGMQERLRLIGGELTIETAPGHGTTIRAQVRVPEEQS